MFKEIHQFSGNLSKRAFRQWEQESTGVGFTFSHSVVSVLVTQINIIFCKFHKATQRHIFLFFCVKSSYIFPYIYIYILNRFIIKCFHHSWCQRIKVLLTGLNAWAVQLKLLSLAFFFFVLIWKCSCKLRWQHMILPLKNLWWML